MFKHNITGIEFKERLIENVNENSKIFMFLNSFDILFLNELKKIFNKNNEIHLITTKKESNVENWQQYFLDFCYDKNEYFISSENIISQINISKSLNDFVSCINDFKFSLKQDYSFICIKNENEIINFNFFNPNNQKLTLKVFENDHNIIIDYFFSNSSNYIQEYESILNNELLTTDYRNDYKEFLKTYFKENSPHFMYYYNLLHIFKKDINSHIDVDRKNNVSKNLGESVIWNKLFQFQKDGVVSAINKLNLFGGCIIADSVGLGKTFTALAVIKYFQNQNKNILVLTPKRLRENWESFKQPYEENFLFDDKFNYQILNHSDIIRKHGKSGSLDLSKIKRENYDLIVIDESHNFRNAYGLNSESLNRRNRYNDLINEFIKPGVKTNVLMLSATPINNNFNDLKNQLTLFTFDNDNLYSEYGIDSISKTFQNVNSFFNHYKNQDNKKMSHEYFLENVDQNYLKLLSLSSIARSRENINQFVDNENDKIVFPKRLEPINIYSSPSYDNNDLITTIYNEMKLLKLPAYSVLKYLLNSKIDELSKIILENKFNFESNNDDSLQEDGSEDFLIDQLIYEQINRNSSAIQLLVVNLFKRLESSIFSFKTTLKGFIEKTKKFKEFLNGEIDFETYIESNDSLSKIYKKINEKKINLVINRNSFDVNIALNDINHDLDILNRINQLIDVESDVKIEKLKKVIYDKVQNPLNKDNKKIIIFTAYADTAEYIYDKIIDFSSKLGLSIGLITGSKKRNSSSKVLNHDRILDYFSPKSKYFKIPENEKEIDIIVCTDVVSEGQNLQDCDFLINYDIHWNPVRIFQRFGRIDRIGSENKYVKMVNFWPTKDIDNYINLSQKVNEKLFIGSLSTTGDNIFDVNKNDPLKFRWKQIIAMQKGEEFEDSDNILKTSDLGYEEFLNDLKKQINQNADFLDEKIKDIITCPIGLMGCTKKNNHKEGVIFLFKELSDRKNNGISPYYLIYIDWKGNILFNYKQSREILLILKELCFNKKEVQYDIVEKYKELTNNYFDMSHINFLANKAIESTVENNYVDFQLDSLFSNEIRESDVLDKNKMQLISFVVVM